MTDGQGKDKYCVQVCSLLPMTFVDLVCRVTILSLVFPFTSFSASGKEAKIMLASNSPVLSPIPSSGRLRNIKPIEGMQA